MEFDLADLNPSYCPAVEWSAHSQKMKDEGRCVQCGNLLPVTWKGVENCTAPGCNE